MALASQDVQRISSIDVPDIYSLQDRIGPVRSRQLAREAGRADCTAQLVAERNGRVTALDLTCAGAQLRLQLKGSASTQLPYPILEADEFAIGTAGDLSIRKCKAINFFELHSITPQTLRSRILASWDNALRFKQEERSVSGTLEKPGLRPPQVGALHAIAAHWTISQRPALVVMPTGTGKTEVMLATAVHSQPSRLLVLVPSNALRLQTFEKFLRLGVLYKAEILELTAIRPVVGMLKGSISSAEELAAIEQCNVVVSTVAAIQGLSDKELIAFLDLFDAVFFDEAHHLPASSWERVHSRLKTQRVLQFTATPYRHDGQRIVGRIIYNFPLRLAQKQGYFRKIKFSEVFETDTSKADQKIAERAVKHLRDDIAAGLNHVLLARTDTMTAAEALLTNVYAQYTDLNPVVIHSGSRDHARKLEEIKRGNHKIVVCVNMFGEGFDLPSLKVAALHVPHKSLAITLQFTGRFTRDAQGIGDATVVANTADVRVSEAIEELYAEDSDWNELIPEMSGKAVQSVLNFSEFLDKINFSEKGDEELFGLNVLQPKTSTVMFNVKAFTPSKFRIAIGRGTYVERSWQSKDKDLLIFITRSRIPIEWANVKEATDEVWHLYLVAHDPMRHLLFIYSSQKSTLHVELAKAVSNGTATLLSGEQMFRGFHDIHRLIFYSAGLYNRGMKLRFRFYTGLDISEAIDPATLSKSSKSNLFGVGYEAGERTSIGVSHKGRVWSMSSSSIPDWVEWCRKTATKILDTSIPTDTYLKNTLLPKEIAALPQGELFVAMLPVVMHTEEFAIAQLLLGGAPVPTLSLGIKEMTKLSDTAARLLCAIDQVEVTFQLRWGPADGAFSVSQTAGQTVEVRFKGSTQKLETFFRDDPPTILFVDGSEVRGGRMLQKRDALPLLFDPNQIAVLSWSGVNIEEESKWKNGQQRTASVQGAMLDHLRPQQNTFLFDDDDSGEVADIVEILEPARDEVLFRFYHCKFAGGDQPGQRVKDLYEVCGQAVRSVRWMDDPFALLKHLQERELKKRNGRPTRFEKGDLRQLIALRRRMKRLRPRHEVFVVQPGLSKAGVEPAYATPLAAANGFILELTGSPLHVFASA